MLTIYSFIVTVRVVVGCVFELFKFKYKFEPKEQQRVNDLLHIAMSEDSDSDKIQTSFCRQRKLPCHLPADAYHSVYKRTCSSTLSPSETDWQMIDAGDSVQSTCEYLIMSVLAEELQSRKV